MKTGLFEGRWWLPADPGAEVAGVLAIDFEADVFELRLIGSFKPLTSLFASAEYELIHGVIQRDLVTLTHLQEARSEMSSPGFVAQKLHPVAVYFGNHLTKPDPTVERAWIELTHLPDWMMPPKSDVRRTQDGKSVTASMTVDPDIECDLPIGTVTFRQWVSYERSTRKVVAESAASVAIAPTHGAQYSEFQAWISTLQNLLSLATGVPNAVEEVQVEVAAESLATEPRPLKSLEVVYERVFQADATAARKSADFLFGSADLPDFCESIRSWFRASEELDAVINLHFSTRHRPNVFLETRFLTAAQAAEVYHRRRLTGGVLPKPEHKNRIRRVLESVSAADVDWLRSALAGGNEKWLALRLEELLAQESLVMDPIVPDRAAFVRQVVDTRNYFTHWERPAKSPPTNRDVFLLAERLGILVSSCLIAELGFSAEDRLGLFERNAHYRWVRGELGPGSGTPGGETRDLSREAQPD